MQLHLASRFTTAKRSFNPHPTRRPGATKAGVLFWLMKIGFQSSPDPEAGCNMDKSIFLCNALFQSSPDPEAGCNQKP